MAKADIDAYLAKLPDDRRAALEGLRSFIHETLPEAQETIQYKMPAFATDDVVCTMASQKNYMALYICKPALVDRYRQHLTHLNCGKGCIRFKTLDDLPLEPIADLLRDAAADPGFH